MTRLQSSGFGYWMQHVGKAFQFVTASWQAICFISKYVYNYVYILYTYHIFLQPLPIPWQLFYDAFAKKNNLPLTHDSGSPHRVQYIGVATTPSMKHSWTVCCVGPVLAWLMKNATLKLTASLPLKWLMVRPVFRGKLALSETKSVYINAEIHALKICHAFNGFHCNSVHIGQILYQLIWLFILKSPTSIF